MRSRDLFDKRREPSLERPRKFSRLICRAGFCGLLISVHLGILEKNVYETFHILLGCSRNHGRLAALIAPGPGHARIKPLPGVSRSAIRVITIAII